MGYACKCGLAKKWRSCGITNDPRRLQESNAKETYKGHHYVYFIVLVFPEFLPKIVDVSMVAKEKWITRTIGQVRHKSSNPDMRIVVLKF
jgi:hypothetical protein